MQEPRAAVMILVEASWQEQGGTLRAVPARMLDKSAGGACIQLPTPVAVGSKLNIQARWERFSGIAKYCHSEGHDFLVGIQREVSNSLAGPQASAADNQPRATTTLPGSEEKGKPSPTAVGQRKSPVLQAAANAGPPPEVARISPGPKPPAKTEIPAQPPPRKTEAHEERKTMRSNWLEHAPWHNKQGESGRSVEKSPSRNGDEAKLSPQIAPHAGKALSNSASEAAATFQVELLPVDDVYRAAAVMNPRRGYGIRKVVEMLHSEHIRGLSPEMKRAAVLMALHAAGVSIGEVLTDAKARQDALTSYEAERRKQIEAEWARKSQENLNIEAELERVKAQYKARISRNLEAVEREKAGFEAWLAKQRQESESMTEAVNLCLQKPAVEPADSPAEPVAMAAAAK